MKDGRSLEDLAKEIQRQAATKVDYVSDTRALSVQVEGKTPVLAMQNGSLKTFGITPLAHSQLGERIGIPAKYYDRMRTEAPGLLADNLNHWLSNKPAKYMVRTLDGNARAFLSDRYRPLDNLDLATAVLPLFAEAGCRVESCEVTESRLYLKAVTPKVSASVEVGDIVQAGVCISNSEVGQGAIKVEPLIYRLVCKNGAIISDMAMKRNHVGRAGAGTDFDHAAEYYRDETRIADDRAFWMKIQDTVRAVLDVAIFEKIVARWKEAKGQKIEVSPIVVVEKLSKHFGMTEAEEGGILKHLIDGGDLSAYGMMNAITRTAQDSADYDRSTELEHIGPAVLQLSQGEWSTFNR